MTVNLYIDKENMVGISAVSALFWKLFLLAKITQCQQQTLEPKQAYKMQASD